MQFQPQVRGEGGAQAGRDPLELRGDSPAPLPTPPLPLVVSSMFLDFRFFVGFRSSADFSISVSGGPFWGRGPSETDPG